MATAPHREKCKNDAYGSLPSKKEGMEKAFDYAVKLIQ